MITCFNAQRVCFDRCSSGENSSEVPLRLSRNSLRRSFAKVNSNGNRFVRFRSTTIFMSSRSAKKSKRKDELSQKRRSQQKWVKGQLRDRLGLSPAAVEVSFLVISVATVTGMIGLVAAVLVPTLITTLSLAAFVAPMILVLLSTVAMFATIGGLLLPIPLWNMLRSLVTSYQFTMDVCNYVANQVQLFLAGFSLLSLLSGIIIPAIVAALLGIFVLSKLTVPGTDQVSEEEDEKTSAEEEEKKAEDRLNEEMQRELLEFDRRLLGEVSEWSVGEVGSWLLQIGFEDLVVEFARNEIDGQTLITLGKEELRDDLGVTSLPRRRKLSEQIDALKARSH
mmetsp:Transcript_7632/g.10311  ORF Transcript_7632/g.10311 Transcript_7632/m.10311 type:complete len:337 (+) Transcript_7632:87-1097(+)